MNRRPRRPPLRYRRPSGEGICGRCGRMLDSPVGCRCAPMPESFPRRDAVTGELINPATGEVIARPAPRVCAAPAPEPVQLPLFDDDAAAVLRVEGLAAVRAAAQRRSERC